MPICTYINDQDIKNWSQCEDKELNDLLQEARKVEINLLISTITVKQGRGWFRKPKFVNKYSIRINNGYEAQILNLPQDHDWSINTYYSKSYAMTYLYGFLNGIDRLQATEGKQEGGGHE